jgi:hypothetical protein
MTVTYEPDLRAGQDFADERIPASRLAPKLHLGADGRVELSVETPAEGTQESGGFSRRELADDEEVDVTRSDVRAARHGAVDERQTDVPLDRGGTHTSTLTPHPPATGGTSRCL